MTVALLFVASAVLLVLASELFTNAIEWAGYRLRLGTGATGSLLAAFGTSLPEMVVPVVALIAHAPSADSVAIGAVLGAPFLLLTLGVAVTGLAVLSRPRAHALVIDRRQPRRDLGVFVIAFSAVLICTVLPFPARVGVGVALLATYGGYVVATPLHVVRWRAGQPHTLLISGQLTAAVLLLVVGSDLFVRALNQAASALNVPTLILALVVVPLATELPETLNSVLWVRSRDDMLAFGNVAGSSAFQSCVLAFIGVVFTTWRPGPGGLISGVVTLATAAFLLAVLWRGRAHGALLLCAGLPWAGYVIAQVVTAGHLGG